MKDQVVSISEFINNTGLISRWGGWCINKTDKEMHYGIGIEPDCKGNIYGYDDNEVTTSYLYVESIIGETNPATATIAINVFTPSKKIGELTNTYAISLNLFAILKKKYKDVSISTPNPQKYAFQEWSTIRIRIRAFGICSPQSVNDSIC